MKRVLAATLTAALIAPAASASTIEKLGTGLTIALPVASGALTLWKKDYDGTLQLAVSTALTVGTTYGLAKLVKECRPFARPCAPGSSNWDSFPSDHAGVAFASAEFLRERYGWSYGLPAYAFAGFVGWSRVDAQKHHWGDIAASAAISILYNELITTRYQKPYGVYSSLQAESDGVYASLNYKF